MAATTPTYLAYQHNADLLRLQTTVQSIQPFSTLESENRDLFKTASDDDFVIVTKDTIFHPQGGGQPSDEGTMTAIRTGCDVPGIEVRAARMDAMNEGRVLHLVRFINNTEGNNIRPGDCVEQMVNAEKRLLYSRLHTAGHVLGSAVRHLLEDKVADFDELKASHFPESASCEFRGSIEGKWKDSIQNKVNDFIKRAMPVEIDFWSEDDFRREGVSHLIPNRQLLLPGQDRFRVVRIVGAEVYPCGGTHVESTDLCGETTVRKISRSKGTSKVSYSVS
ncbi:hypothetical protein N7474_010259 [Penicillium riverlandense]|uniref:uncharacterized protein n=1 Tax=Penicillium riverlandense TaxID=1903569 RepID=UPI002549417A|nr:uncharacterized protein N7474_010259 [Penicillium riverlandense]KAJ5808990.1 hypothetical protein N7474_010259 [Penicillium riverlandense]